MVACYYCENNEATTERFEKPCCEKCHQSVWFKKVEAYGDNLPQQDLAKRYKALLKTFSF